MGFCSLTNTLKFLRLRDGCETEIVTQPSRNRKNFKVFVKLQNPTSCVESGNCDPSVKRQSFSDVSFTFTQYSTTEERALMRTELAALLKDPLLIDAVDNLNPAY